MKSPPENPATAEQRKKRLRAVLIFATSVYGVLMIILGYAWYADQWNAPFHFFNDLPEWKQLDKVAHFFWTFQASSLCSRFLAWAYLDDRKCAQWGTLMGFLFVSLVEVSDGFSESYGASAFDIMANGLGALAFVGQRLFWKRVLVWPKFSFHPTMFAPLRPALLGSNIFEEILKDYNGQTFWYSINIKQSLWPQWLVFAVGVSAEGMVYGRDTQNEAMGFSPYRKFYLSVDLNLSGVKTSSRILNTLLYVANIIKIPAPAIEFSTNGIRFHPIYF